MNRIFKNRPLLIIAASQSVSGIGNWISLLAVFALIVFYNGGGVIQTSWIMLAGLGPMLLCSLPAGGLTDRFDRKWLMIISEFCSGLAVLGIILSRRVESIYALLVLQSASGSLMAPASQAALPSLVQKEELTQANALLQQLTSIIKIGAPLFAGFLLAFLRPQQAMIFDVISYGLSVLILCFLPALPPVKEAKSDAETSTGDTEQLAAPKSTGSVLATLRASGQLRLLFVIGFFFVLIIGNFDLLAPVFIRDGLRQSASLFGLLIGLVGIGMAASSGWLLLRKGKSDHWQDIIIGCLCLALLPASISLASLLGAPGPGITIVSIGCIIGGLGNALVLIQSGTLLQLLVPHQVLGRISGLFQSILAGAQLITLLITPLFVPTHIAIGPFLGMGALALVLLTGCTILLYKARYNNKQLETPLQSLIMH